MVVSTVQPRATLTFEGDLLVWGASLWGDSDPSVIVAEYGDHYWHRGPLWDSQGRSPWLRSSGDGYEPVPLFWSLPWVSRWLAVQPEKHRQTSLSAVRDKISEET